MFELFVVGLLGAIAMGVWGFNKRRSREPTRPEPIAYINLITVEEKEEPVSPPVPKQKEIETLDQFVNQEHIKGPVRAIVEAVHESMNLRYCPHLLLIGPAGTGKTTLAKIIAKSIPCEFVSTVGSELRKPDDVISKLRKVSEIFAEGKRCVFFIDEIHSVAQKESVVADYLKPVLEEGAIYSSSCNFPLIERREPGRIYLPYFPIIAATTDQRKLDKALRSRFLTLNFSNYSNQHLVEVANLHADMLEFLVQPEVAEAVVKYATFPREVVQMLELVKIYMTAQRRAYATGNLVEEIAAQRDIHPGGVNRSGLAVLRALKEKPQARGRIAFMSNETPDDVEDALERLFAMRLVAVGYRHEITQKGKEYLEKYGSSVSS